MTNSSNESKYFDLHTTGIGYLNRIREVKPRKGSPFMAVTVAALHGKTEEAEYSYIDCNVVGAEAETLIRRCQEAVDAGKKVLVSFRIGDIWADVFTYQSGAKQGQTCASLKGRLLYIAWIKVDGAFVYETKPREVASATEQVLGQTVEPLKSEIASEPTIAENQVPAPAKRQRSASK